MKKSLFVCILLLAPMNSANADVQFRMVPLGEYVKSAGSFVLETGKKAREGIQQLLLVWRDYYSPFRADVYKQRREHTGLLSQNLITEKDVFIERTRNGKIKKWKTTFNRNDHYYKELV